MSKKRFPGKSLVLFDLDGTLVDSVPDLAHSVDHMMLGLGLPACGENRVRRYVGNGAQRLIERALTSDMDARPEPQLFQQAHRLFFDHYAANVCCHSALYPGTMQALTELSGNGFTLACVTNKPGQFTAPLLEALSIAGFFKLVLSGDSLPKKKPDPLPLIYAVEQLGEGITQSVMVGDSRNDILAAKSAGMDSIAVSYGYNHGINIELSGPDIVVDSLSQTAAHTDKSVTYALVA